MPNGPTAPLPAEHHHPVAHRCPAPAGSGISASSPTHLTPQAGLLPASLARAGTGREEHGGFVPGASLSVPASSLLHPSMARTGPSPALPT